MLKSEKYHLVLDVNWLRGGLEDSDSRRGGVLDGDLRCRGLVGDWWRGGLVGDWWQGGLVSVDERDMESTVVSITEYRSSCYGSADSAGSH